MPCRAGHSHPAAPKQILLDAAPADIERVTSETNDMEGIHDRCCVREFFGRSGPESCEPIHPDHLNSLAPFPGPFSEPLPEHGPRPALDHVQQPGGARLGADWGEVDDHGDVVVTEPRVTTDMLVDTDRGGPRTWPGRRSAAARLPRARRRSPRSTTPRDLPRGGSWSMTIPRNTHATPRREVLARGDKPNSSRRQNVVRSGVANVGGARRGLSAMVSVKNLHHPGGPRPLPGQRRAQPTTPTITKSHETRVVVF
ncbi:MAG: hypothetical protein ACFWTS_05635 [Pseudoclavibacter caeni]